MITCSMRAIEERVERYTSAPACAVEDPFLQRRRERRKGSGLFQASHHQGSEPNCTSEPERKPGDPHPVCIIPAAHPRLDAERCRGSLVDGAAGKSKYLFAS